jgi:2-polyprenyl-3-methyl-5-hydroxy-6-metoxy-1,4-benzoquinol methylase
MRIGDYLIQMWRMQVAARWIPKGSRVLDIGCHQGEFLSWLGDKITPSVGLDPLYKENATAKKHQFFNQTFQEDLPFEEKSFDAVVLLATIEHIQEKSIIAREAARLLHRGGRVIITVPSLMVDRILEILILLRIVDGMSLEEHHGFLPNELPDIFIPEGFSLRKKQKFQFGLNNLYIFERK